MMINYSANAILTLLNNQNRNNIEAPQTTKWSEML